MKWLCVRFLFPNLTLIFPPLLSQITGYQVRINALALKNEFATQIEEMQVALEAIAAAADACENKDILVIIKIVLHIGNFMNAGGHSGDCGAFTVCVCVCVCVGVCVCV